jgi:hydrogenase nickel incorporation protein HypB
MCGTCGCGEEGGARIEGEHEHRLPDGTVIRHHHHGDAHGHHHHHHHHHHEVTLDRGPAGTEVAGMSRSRMVKIERDILAKNDAYAARNRQRFERDAILAINLMSSPGSGKTTLLVRTLEALRDDVPVAVIEGDQQTSLDAERIRATGTPALQVNTGKGCHLDANMVERAVPRLTLDRGGILFIENVGNLVCPAGFDLGEHRRVVLCSVTEGEDKPEKYPNMFVAADLVIINKIDLLPYVPIDIDTLERGIRRIQPRAEILRLSATTGEGFDAWTAWLEGARTADSERAAQ